MSTPTGLPERDDAQLSDPEDQGTSTDRVKAMKGEAVDNRDAFTTETAGLPEASSPSVVRLYDGDVFDMRIHHVRKRVGDAEVRMLGYNGSVPGPTLRVDQGSEITVNVTNDRDVGTTAHWPRLRRED